MTPATVENFNLPESQRILITAAKGYEIDIRITEDGIIVEIAKAGLVESECAVDY